MNELEQLGLTLEPDTARWSEEERELWELIKPRTGKESAVSAAELSRNTGIADRRLRDMVKALVEKRGMAICSCPRGYYIPQTPEEIEETLHMLVSWALSAMKRASRLRRSRKMAQLVGQLEIELRKVTPAA